LGSRSFLADRKIVNTYDPFLRNVMVVPKQQLKNAILFSDRDET
jgi:hypothetical protein